MLLGFRVLRKPAVTARVLLISYLTLTLLSPSPTWKDLCDYAG